MKRAITLLLLSTVFFPSLTIDGFDQEKNKIIGHASLINVYYGMLHSHSSFSDGTGDPQFAYRYARDNAHLDFFGLADHAELLDQAEWDTLRAVADDFNSDGSFVAFRGFEWSHSLYGHVAVIDSREKCSAIETATDTFGELLRFLNARNCFAFFNHPGRHDASGIEFDHFAGPVSQKIVGMELWNKTDGFDVYYFNDGYIPGDGGRGFFDEALDSGWRIGASGSDDNHQGTFGTDTDYRMAVIAASLTRRSIREAVYARRFFSTSDKDLRISFIVNDFQMGSVISPGVCRVLITACDDEIISRIELIRNGAIVRTWNVNSTEPCIEYAFKALNGDYFYIKVEQEDGDLAISSPVWFDIKRVYN